MTDSLYIDDDDLAKRLGVAPKTVNEALRVLDHDPRSGFPKKQPLWGNRRYWPAVKAYFDRANGLKIPQNRREEDAA